MFAPRLDEESYLRLVMNRPEQRSRLAPVRGVGIGPSIQKQLDSCKCAEARRMMQRRRSGMVPGIDQFGLGSDKRCDFLGVRPANCGEEGHGLRINRFGRGALLNLDTKLRALIDPGAKQTNLVVRKRSRRWHLQSAVTADDTTYELARAAVARNDYRAIITAAKSRLPAIEPKACLLHFGSMAGMALLGKQRLDVFFEIDLDLCGFRQFRLCGSQYREAKEKD